MKVDGFVTSRELYEVHDMTTAQIQRFLPTPDEEALFHSSDGESGSGCALYTENRVNDVLNSVEYRAEREKTERRREGARKGSVKQAETRARKRAIAEKVRAVSISRDACTPTVGRNTACTPRTPSTHNP